jgi:FAD binding domain/Berberine and berberine like
MLGPTTISSSANPIGDHVIRKFETSLQGEIIRPSHARYELARKGWIGLVDPRRPLLIARCAATADVERSAEFARANELPIAVRAGGHSTSGDSFCDGGMVIDVSAMKRIEVNAAARTARADAGLTASEFDRATQAFGLATVLGECSSVGIAGYTLGGGLGRLMGQHGVACDNLLSVELVGANGKIIHANQEENADLFWAIRGGGGNFGIATSFEYRLHPVTQILGGALVYPIADTRKVLTFLDEYMMTVPDEFDLVIDIGNNGVTASAPGTMEPVISLMLSYCGDIAQGELALEPLRSFRKPLADSIRVMPYLQMQGLSTIQPLIDLGSSGALMSFQGGFIERIGADAINTIESFIAEAPPTFWIAAEHYLHSAALRPSSDEMAFALRRRGYSTRIFSAWRDPKDEDVSLTWINRLGAALERFSGGAMYLNYLMANAGAAGTKAAYGSNYQRLGILKKKYDPDNFFKSNRNIEPLSIVS